MSFILVQALTGLAGAASLFLVAAGLTIVFGVTRIVNFAHGSLYMIGAYVAVTLARDWGGALGFWGAVACAALAVGAFGALIEIVLLRRIYKSPELFQLLATFGLVLVIQDITRAVWGAEDLLGPRAPGLDGAFALLGHQVPQYDIALIAIGAAVLGGLWLLFHRTRFGVLVRAATEDREMVALLGVDQRVLFTAVLFLGAALAGLGGALQMPRQAASLDLDLLIIVEAFVVVVVGGMGSIAGAALAAILVAEIHAFGIVLVPKSTLVLIFLVMAATLVLRPAGLLGRAGAESEEGGRAPPPTLRPARGLARLAWPLTAAAMAVAPVVIGEWGVVLATEIVVYALMAASLHFILWGGGLVSFGHAAYFGLGAYGAALAVKHLAAGMTPALALAPLAAALGAAVYGWFAVRRAGIYMAMLTLAFAQMTWSAAFQWVRLTGGDNGILGVWPDSWADDPLVFYYLALAVCGATIWGLQRVVHAPFGHALRAGRDSALRAEALGIDVLRVRWLAFTLAGAAAGVAGGFFAFAKGSVFPNILHVGTSLDALVMVLLGGVEHLAGPLAGALAYTGLAAELVRRTAHWQLILGGLVILLVLVLPRGLAGLAARADRAEGET